MSKEEYKLFTESELLSNLTQLNTEIQVYTETLLALLDRKQTILKILKEREKPDAVELRDDK